jgi:phosphoribosylformylglycinamidine cyclo-ligase
MASDNDRNEAGLTYQSVGVDYGLMDPFKVAAQQASLRTANNIAHINGGTFWDFAPSRGESVYLIETPTNFLAHIEEGLGTKNRVAEAMQRLTGGGSYFFYNIAQDCVAMIVNDMITLGAAPLSVAMHLAVGESEWFKDIERSSSLITGWMHACDLARCVWGCGETPTLKNIILPGTFVLSGSAMGIIEPKSRRIKGNVESGDAIILIESSGIHANGLTMAQAIADTLPNGYLTKVPGDGRTYGEVLLDPTHTYVPLIETCLNRGIDIHYAVNITGHGWRKLMRLDLPFTYVIEQLPDELPIFNFIKEHGSVTDEEMYGNFNMGAGFALYVPEKNADAVVSAAKFVGLNAWQAGFIDTSSEKRVVIEPKCLEYKGKTLGIRA